MLPDEYSRNARLKPALIVAIPIAAVTGLISAAGLTSAAYLSSIIASATALGLTALLAQLGRDLGKKKEAHLFAHWGGKPSVAMLRHSDKRLNTHTRKRYHEKAKYLMPDLALPDPTSESAATREADLRYEAFSDLLLERTRDNKKFPLVFQELVNYGFRRNLWGMKRIGVSVSVASLVAIFILALTSHPPRTELTAATLIDLTLLLLWWKWITPTWVKTVADAYARQLLAACEHL